MFTTAAQPPSVMMKLKPNGEITAAMCLPLAAKLLLQAVFFVSLMLLVFLRCK
jgi:hypothetical protein